MKTTHSILALAIAATGLVSCGSQEEHKEEADVKVKEIENCVYSYNPDKTDLKFTAYKFIRKAGVSGTFTGMQVEGELSGAVPKDILESISFSIPTSTVETNNADRNKKIDSLFFGELAGTHMITGEVVKLDESKGEATLSVTMNDITNEVNGAYTLEDNKFTFSAEINVNEWDAQEGIKALNEACKDLHTDVENGDTESKLWPDVTLEFETVLDKKCD